MESREKMIKVHDINNIDIVYDVYSKSKKTNKYLSILSIHDKSYHSSVESHYYLHQPQPHRRANHSRSSALKAFII